MPFEGAVRKSSMMIASGSAATGSGKFYGIQLATNATAGSVYLHDILTAVTAVTTALTPIYQLAANSSFAFSLYRGIPFATGIYVTVSGGAGVVVLYV